MSITDYIGIFLVTFAGIASGIFTAYYAIQHENNKHKNKQLLEPRAEIIVSYSKQYEYYCESHVDYHQWLQRVRNTPLEGCVRLIQY